MRACAPPQSPGGQRPRCRPGPPRLKNGSRVARVPQATGGRAAHPPKVEKILVKEINRKEKRKAFRSAIAASTYTDLVRGRGHLFEGDLPLVFEDRFEEITPHRRRHRGAHCARCLCDVERAKGSRKVRAGAGAPCVAAATSSARAF